MKALFPPAFPTPTDPFSHCEPRMSLDRNKLSVAGQFIAPQGKGFRKEKGRLRHSRWPNPTVPVDRNNLSVAGQFIAPQVREAKKRRRFSFPHTQHQPILFPTVSRGFPWTETNYPRGNSLLRKEKGGKETIDLTRCGAFPDRAREAKHPAFPTPTDPFSHGEPGMSCGQKQPIRSGAIHCSASKGGKET